MIIDIHATITLDGFIADDVGSEDLFDDSNWQSMVKLSKNYNAVLWGRKTYENVVSWGSEYIDALNHLNIYVLTSKNHLSEKSNVKFVKNFNKIKEESLLVEGGKSVYDYVLQNKIVNIIYLNVAPVIIQKGVPFTSEKEIFDCYNKVKVTEQGEHYTQIALAKSK